MNEWLNLSDGGWWNVAGWTMLHFLWLGTLVGLAAGVCRLVLRRSSASDRYVAALACFIALAALPIGIGAWLVNAQRSAAIDVEPVAIDVTRDVPVQRQVVDLAVSKPATATAPGATGSASASFVQPTNNTNSPSLDQLAASLAQSAAEYLPWLWLTGTPLTFLLLTTGVIGAERLRRSSRILDDGPIAEACAELASSLRIGREVTVAICERIASPVLIGIVRPMILLPSSALTGWSPEEIEMVLLHELAHVRRWDNFVNLLQRFVEAALFFHPAVWLVSRWVRAEREACCDAVVVGRTNRPHAYAETLVALAAQLPRSVLFHPAASSAMATGPLRSRIHRILSLDDDPMLVSGKSLGVMMSGLLLTATLVVLNLPTNGEGKESIAKVKETIGRDEGGLRLPETKYLKIIFRADKENPLQTRQYPAPPALARTLLLAFESLQRDPFGPQLDFESSWDRDRSALEITAPLKAHEAIFSVYIPKAIEAESRKRHDESASGGMNDHLDDVAGEQIGNRIESVDSRPVTFTDDKLQQVPFVAGATKFADGDHITITEIRGTAETFKPGNEYWIKGTYKLSSRDRATLGASVTVHSSTIARTPHDPDQSVDIVRGSGEFMLKLPMPNDGWPHVSFYPADRGQSFGGVYFGTGDTLLAEWWKEPPKGNDQDGDPRIETEAVRQEQKRQAESMNKLKNLALALLNYNDAKGSLPANASYDSFDRPLLSWRVHILPYLDVDGKEDLAALYKEFRLDEPWDSEHNRKLIPRMPAVFQNPNRPAGPFTNYVAAVGSDCVFDGTPKGTSLSQIPDGTANTIMLVEADEAVEWTRPADLNFYSAIQKSGLGNLRPNGWLAVFADGSVNLIGKDKSAREVRDLFTCGRRKSGTEIKLPDLNQSAQEGADEFRAKFVPTEDNPLETHVYAINNAPNAILRLEWTTKMLERKPGEPKVVFGYNWKDDFTHLEIITPNAAQEFLKPQILASQTTSNAPAESATFPSLEEQKLADIAWKRLGFEFTPLPKNFKKNQSKDLIDYVRENGYDGGVLVTVKGNPRMEQNDLQQFDILVGLHAWPVTTMEDLAKILAREDLAELNPLKFYALRVSEVIDDGRELEFGRVTGRIYANLDDPLPRTTAPASEDYYAERSVSLTPQQMAEMVTPQPAQPQALAPAPQPDANLGDSHPNQTLDAMSAPADAPPWMADLKTKLRDREPLNVVFFYVDHSESCRRMRDMLQQFQRKYINLPLNILSKDAEVERHLAVKYDIERVPALLFVDGDNQVLKKTYGDITESQFAEYLLEVAGQLPDVSATPPTLRYDGRTFEEWRTAWQTELSLEKRLEVVKALAAFGASGRGKEAAEAILDVANQLDWSEINTETAAGRLKQACVDAFVSGRTTEGYRIPTENWWPLVAPIYENSADKQTIVTFLSYQLPAGENDLIPRLLELSNQNEATRNLALSGLKAIDPKLEDGRVVSRLRESLKDANKSPGELRGAITSLFYSSSGGGGGYGPQTELRWVPELQPLLFHPDPEVRQSARFAITKAQPRDAAPLVKYLVDVVDAKGRERDRCEAIRALATLGMRAAPAEEKLKAIARDSTDGCRMSAAVALLAMWPDIANWDSESKLRKLFGEIESGDSDDVSRKLKAEEIELFGVDTQSYGGGGLF